MHNLCLIGRVYTELTKQKQNSNPVFCDKSAAILQNLRNISGTRLCFLQLSVQLPVGEDQNVSVLLKVSLPAGWSQRIADFQQCAEDMDLTTGKWNTEETCKIFSFLYLILASPKNASCFFKYIFDARSIKPAAAMRMSSFSSFSLQQHFMY